MDRKLMCVFAHPDDESLGMGGVLVKYAAEGVEIALVAATRGERGWAGKPEDYPGAAELGRIREGELRCAAQRLGVREVTFLGYLDGEVGQAPPGEIVLRIASEIRRFKPQVVVTFAPDGVYGHPDHIAISQFTQAAILAALDASLEALAGSAPQKEGLAPHRVLKLYYMVNSLGLVELVREVMGGIEFWVNGELRRHVGWQDWMITTQVDASAYWQAAWEAIQCHASQLLGMGALQKLTPEQHRFAWGRGNFYRVFSLGQTKILGDHHQVERDLFEGL